MPADPADIARIRTATTEQLIGEAQEAESDAADYAETDNLERETLRLARANNRRLQALCNHLGLPHPPMLVEPPAEEIT